MSYTEAEQFDLPLPGVPLTDKTMITKVPLGVGNRDGDAWAVETAGGRCFLVLGASSLMNPAVFPGMGSTEHVEISRAALAALAPVQEKPRRAKVIARARAIQEQCQISECCYNIIGELIEALEE